MAKSNGVAMLQHGGKKRRWPQAAAAFTTKDLLVVLSIDTWLNPSALSQIPAELSSVRVLPKLGLEDLS